MVTVNGEKMSKSLGNFTTIRDLLEGNWFEYPQLVDPMAIRLFVLQAHYRKPLDFTKAAIAAAEKGWQTLKEALTLSLDPLILSSQMSTPSKLDTESVARFRAALDDDFNTAAGLAVLFELAKSIKREFNRRHYQSEQELSDQQLQTLLETLTQLAQIFGLQVNQDNTTTPELDSDWIESLLKQRHQARQERRYAESDHNRNKLQAVGITIVDQADGQTRWHRS